MSFLAPLFLFGALAVALPVLFHLIRRTTRDRVPFSSLLFLFPTPPRVTRRSRLENLWLLLLRCLVLCLLAAGFARPFLKKAGLQGPDPGVGARIGVLVDTSASMRRAGLWSQARSRAEQMLKSARPTDQVGLFTFDRRLRTLVSFDQWSATAPSARVEAALAKLVEVSPGWGETDLANALIGVAELMEETASRGPADQVAGPKKIQVISDFAAGMNLGGLQGHEWPAELEVAAVPLTPRVAGNAGLQPVGPGETIGLQEGEVVRVRVSNASDTDREQFRLGWAAGAEAGMAGSYIDVYVPPGQSRVFKAPQAGSELGTRTLLLEGDAEPFDNRAYFFPPQVERVDLIYMGRESETDPGQPLYYLKRAFPDTGRQRIEVTAGPASEILQSDRLAKAALLVVAEPVAGAAAERLRSLLQEGRTILLLLRSPSNAATLAQLAGLGAVTCTEASPADYAMLESIEFQHPLFAPFRDPRYSDFTKIHVWKFRRLSDAEIPGAKVLARFDSGEPAWLELPVGSGRLHVLATGWQPADSQLALSSKFVPLLYSLLSLSGVLKAQPANYVIGDPVSLPSEEVGSGATVVKPDQTEILLTNQAQFLQTDLPGIYTLRSGTSTQGFSVNLAYEESRTAPMDLEELQRLGLPLKPAEAVDPKRAAERQARLQAAEQESRQKLWRWLLTAAVVMLLLETWLAGRVTRRAAESTA